MNNRGWGQDEAVSEKTLPRVAARSSDNDSRGAHLYLLKLPDLRRSVSSRTQMASLLFGRRDEDEELAKA